MPNVNQQQSANREVYDYVIIGSGFGGSVCAMRLVEKGYSVLVLERGKRFEDKDYPLTNLNLRKYLWLPALGCFGIMQFSFFKDILAVHGDGVGGGSLVYGNVLMRPEDQLFEHPSWRSFQDWKGLLQIHYETAERMLGVCANPCLWPADHILKGIDEELNDQPTFEPTRVGVLFGKDPGDEENKEVPDPYFAGNGPSRKTCIQCGGCMVGCRYNAKNSLVKNYLYFAEKWGARIVPEAWAHDVIPLPINQIDLARYEVAYHRTTDWLFKKEKRLYARNVIISAGTLGTLSLLFHCRETSHSLPNISGKLGESVRTNSEAILGVRGCDKQTDYSKGIAITSIFHADQATMIEPVHFSVGSSLIRIFSAPLANLQGSFVKRFLAIIWRYITHPREFLSAFIQPHWAETTTILLAMQTEDNHLQMKLGRSWLTFFSRGLTSRRPGENPVPVRVDIGHRVTEEFSRRIHGFPVGSSLEVLFNIPVTAHIMGGVPLGRDENEGVVDVNFQVHNYPGLYVVDGSIMPGNPGVNPSLTITALAEYAMSKIPAKSEKANDRI